MRVGPYEVERELGRGAMGAVFLARDPRSGARVVVKTLVVMDLDAAERFEREGRIGLALRHPGIVETLEVGRDPARGPYVVMEHVDGPTLREVLAKGPLEPARAAELLREIAIAVEHAHRSGVIHRDLKPANILLDARGRPRVADFGLSRAAWEPSLSATGELAGTPSYLPPEQVTGGSRAHGVPGDVWALGVLLHEALAGEVPFRAESNLALLHAIASDPESPLPAHVPHRLAAVVRRCLEKEPAKRWPSAAAVAAELESLEERAPSRRGILALGGALSVLVVAGAVAASARRPLQAPAAPPAAPPRVAAPAGPNQRELIERGRELDDLGCCEAAIAAFTSAIAIGPSADALFERIHARLRLANSKEHGTEILEDARAASGLERGTIRARLFGTSEGVEQLAREARDDPLVIEGLYSTDLMQERPDEALRLADRLIEVSRERWYPRILRTASLRSLGRLDEAESELDAIVAAAPTSSYALYSRSKVRRARGNVAGSLADLDEAIRVDPMAYEARLERASLPGYDLRAALTLLDEVLAFEPHDVAALKMSGSVLVALGDGKSGLARLEKAHEESPRDIQVYDELIDAYQRLKDQDPGYLGTAERLIEEELAIDPNALFPRTQRAALREARGDRAGALEDYERVLPRVGDPDERAALEEAIRNLKAR